MDVVDNILEALPSEESSASSTLPIEKEEEASSPNHNVVDVVSLVLEPWLEQLLVALKTVVTAVWEGGAKQAQRVRERQMEGIILI